MQHTSRLFGSLLSGLGLFALSVCSVSAVQAQGAHAKISAEQAKTVALTKYPGTVEGKIKLEDEEGSWQYAVNVRSGKTLREVMVNAKTGKIANVEVTSKAEEAKEAQAEAKAKAKTTKGHKPVSPASH